jgi:hypothetical protein
VQVGWYARLDLFQAVAVLSADSWRVDPDWVAVVLAVTPSGGGGEEGVSVALLVDAPPVLGSNAATSDVRPLMSLKALMAAKK